MDHDELLDRAIASYSAGGPCEGFSERILRFVRSKRRRWVWTLAPVPALAAVCAVWMMNVQVPQPTRIAFSSVSEAKSAVFEPEPVKPGEKRRRHQIKIADTISPQERALLRWVAESPETAAAELAAFRKNADAPIDIKVLEVEPIAIEEQEK